MGLNIKVNTRLLRLVANDGIEKTQWDIVEPILKDDFKEIKKEMLEEFDEHEITQALQKGPDGEDGIVDNGNLCSLLGIEKGQEKQAVKDLKKFLKDNVILNKSAKKSKRTSDGKVVFQIPVEAPTMEEIDKNSQGYGVEEWSDKSFVKLIEDGIPNFSRYLFFDKQKKNSRSRYAYQSKYGETRHGGGPGPIKWISEILSDLKSKISKNK